MSRNWNILNWNVRGINSHIRWDDIRAKIEESNCGIICLQETKRDYFDQAYLRIFLQEDTTNLHILPLLAYQEGLLLYGMAVSLQDLLSAKIHTKSL